MFYIYILTNQTNKVMYIGVTNDLRRRLYEHKNELISGFTKKYHTHKLVYYESYQCIDDAILREKRLKGLLRIKKNELVETINPDWEDLSNKLFPSVFI
ncbi:MAG: GIY-YIG nuclease family protein [Clostridia bacterium]|nr:GIY-YIG nuclease family protein [Clostridia bacterium]